MNPCCDYVLVCRNGKQISKLRNIFGRIVFLAIGKYKQTCRYDIDKQTSQTCLSEDQKHTSNVTKIYYQKLRSENVAMKTKSCLEKLQDSSKSSEQLTAVNKTTHSSNKIDFEKDEPSKQGLRQKNPAFSDSEDNFTRKGISKYDHGRWTSILHGPSLKFHPSHKLRVHMISLCQKYDSATKGNFGNFTIM